MSLKVVVYIWPIDGEFYKAGHVSATVINLNNPSESTYFSFGSDTPSLEEDRKINKREPVAIELPMTSKLYSAFITDYEQQPYHVDAPQKEKNYQILTNNCAHNTDKILRLCGYAIEEKLTDTLPLTFGYKIYNFAKMALKKQEREFFTPPKESLSKIQYTDIIKQIIDIQIHRFQLKHIKGELIKPHPQTELEYEKSEFYQKNIAPLVFLKKSLNQLSLPELIFTMILDKQAEEIKPCLEICFKQLPPIFQARAKLSVAAEPRQKRASQIYYIDQTREPILVSKGVLETVSGIYNQMKKIFNSKIQQTIGENQRLSEEEQNQHQQVHEEFAELLNITHSVIKEHKNVIDYSDLLKVYGKALDIAKQMKEISSNFNSNQIATLRFTSQAINAIDKISTIINILDKSLKEELHQRELKSEQQGRKKDQSNLENLGRERSSSTKPEMPNLDLLQPTSKANLNDSAQPSHSRLKKTEKARFFKNPEPTKEVPIVRDRSKNLGHPPLPSMKKD